MKEDIYENAKEDFYFNLDGGTNDKQFIYFWWLR